MTHRRYLLVASGGGHLKELFESLPDTFDFNEAILLTYRTKTITRSNGKVEFIVNPHQSFFKYIICSIQTLYYFFLYRPKFVISSGAGIAVPSIVLSRIFKSKLVYIESAAAFHFPSKTGKFAYKYAALFVVQYPQLKKFFPRAVLGTLL